MKTVIINADDFGYSSAVNAGIIKSYQKGILSSTTLMANMSGSDEALILAQENPGLAIGGHLVLTCGSPLQKRKTLTNEKGNFWNLANYKKYRAKMDDNEIFEEWCSQIDYLQKRGINLTHLDSHHHVHTFKENLKITKKVAEKYHLAFRNAYGLEEKIDLPNQKGIKYFDDLMNYPHIRDMELDYEEKKNLCLNEIKTVLERLTEEETTELMVHPAFVDEQLFYHSSFNLARMREVQILCDPEIRKLFESYGINIVNYQDIELETLV